MNFKDIKSKWEWKPIRNCPGRYILKSSIEILTVSDLLGQETEIREYQVDKAKDTVVVAEINDGGIISYKRNDGTCLHTLNTMSGFKRKLEQLGIYPSVAKVCGVSAPRHQGGSSSSLRRTLDNVGDGMPQAFPKGKK